MGIIVLLIFLHLVKLLSVKGQNYCVMRSLVFFGDPVMLCEYVFVLTPGVGYEMLPFVHSS